MIATGRALAYPSACSQPIAEIFVPAQAEGLHQPLRAAIMLFRDGVAPLQRFTILKLDVVAEETMSPIAYNPMTSSLPAAA